MITKRNMSLKTLVNHTPACHGYVGNDDSLSRTFVTKEEWNCQDFSGAEELSDRLSKLNRFQSPRLGFNNPLKNIVVSLALLDNPTEFYLEISQEKIILHVNRSVFRWIENVR